MQVSHCRGFSCWGAWALGCAGFSSFDSQVLVHACMLSHMQLFAPSWTVAHQAPLPMGFSRQEHWNGKKKKNNTGMGCHFFLQGIFPTQGSNPHLPHLLHCRWILYHSATWETSPKVLEHRLNTCALAQAQLLGLSCSKACEIFLDQGSNLYLLHWQEDSLPLSHRGSPMLVLFCELP